MKTLAQQIHSVLVGLAVGDALGVPVEFKSRSRLKENPIMDMTGYGTYNQPPGTFSDDTSLTFCLAEALTQPFDLNTIAKNFIAWYKEGFWAAHGEVFDVGITTRMAIGNLICGKSPLECGGSDEHSNGNGSLMRIAPLLFYLENLPQESRFLITSQVSGITHSHIRSVMACHYYLEFAKCIRAGQSPGAAYQELQDFLPAFFESQGVDPTEISLFDRLLSADIALLSEEEIRSGGYVLRTLEASIWCLLTTTTYRDAVLKAVNLGEDTDTTGAVTGALAGLYYGYDDIPAQWVNTLARRAEIEQLAHRMAQGLDFNYIHHLDGWEIDNFLDALKKAPVIIKAAPAKLQNDKYFILDAVNVNGDVLKFLPEPFASDLEVVLAAVQNKGSALKHANENWKNNEEVVYKAVTKDGNALEFASDTLKNTPHVVMNAVYSEPSAMAFASDSLKADKAFVLDIVSRMAPFEGHCYLAPSLRLDREIGMIMVKNMGYSLKFLPSELQNDRTIVLAAVKQAGPSLKFASEGLRGDREIVLTAVKKYGFAIASAAEPLKGEDAIVLAAIQKDPEPVMVISEDWLAKTENLIKAFKINPDIYRFLPQKFIQDPALQAEISALTPPAPVFELFANRDDREYIRSMVSKIPGALSQASEALKADYEIVMEAVTKDGKVLQHASEGLRNHREIVLAAVKNAESALEYASEELRNDRSIVLAAVKKDGSSWKFASAALKADEEVLLHVIKSSLGSFQPKKMLKDILKDTSQNRDFLLKAVRFTKGEVLKFMPETIRSDRELILEAVKWNGSMLQYASCAFRNDPEIAEYAVSNSPFSMADLPAYLRNDPRLVLQAVKKRGTALKYASLRLRADREIVLAAVRNEGMALLHAVPELRDDKEIVLAAVRLDGMALQACSERLRHDPEIVRAALLTSPTAAHFVPEQLKANPEFNFSIKNTESNKTPY